MSSFRFGVLTVIVALSIVTPGCGTGTAEPEGQAAPDLRANLENTTKAAAEVAKEKPKAP